MWCTKVISIDPVDLSITRDLVNPIAFHDYSVYLLQSNGRLLNGQGDVERYGNCNSLPTYDEANVEALKKLKNTHCPVGYPDRQTLTRMEVMEPRDPWSRARHLNWYTRWGCCGIMGSDRQDTYFNQRQPVTERKSQFRIQPWCLRKQMIPASLEWPWYT